MPDYSQRKYIDLIRLVSSKWVNWNPSVGIKVGAYGDVDKETGELLVEGNVYDPEFKLELEKHNVKINMAEFPPQEGPIGDDLVIATQGAKRKDLNVDKEVNVPSVASALVRGQWLFQRGKRDAVLIMYSPRQISLPPNVVLEHLYKVDKLVGKCLVTNIHVCSAYSMYLSDKSGDKVSLALVAQPPDEVTAGVDGALTWLVDAQTGLLRQACDQAGNYTFTPLYSLKRTIKRVKRPIRDAIRPDPTGDDLWHDDFLPWDPLDEDGEEDPFDPEIYAVDPFAAAEKAAAEAAAASTK